MIKARADISVLSQKRTASISVVSQPSILSMPISLLSSGDNPEALSQARIAKATRAVKRQIDAKPLRQLKTT